MISKASVSSLEDYTANYKNFTIYYNGSYLGSFNRKKKIYIVQVVMIEQINSIITKRTGHIQALSNKLQMFYMRSICRTEGINSTVKF